MRARARLRRPRGDLDGAAADYLQVGQHLAQLRYENPYPAWRLELAEIYLASQRREEARALIEEQGAVVDAFPTILARGSLARSTAALEEDPERWGDLLKVAVDLLAESPYRLEHTRALLDLGRTITAQGDIKGARDILRKAADIADRCGADRLRDEVVLALRDAGAKPRRPRTTGVESLTWAELRGRPKGRDRTYKKRDRSGTVRHPKDRRDPPRQGLPQARHQQPERTTGGARPLRTSRGEDRLHLYRVVRASFA